MTSRNNLTPTQIASLSEIVLQSHFKCKFRVQFFQQAVKFGFVMKLFFETEEGEWVSLEQEYEESINDADILNQELYAKIALMR